MNAITHGLKSILLFRGREPRARFWGYALFVLAIVIVAMMVPFTLQISETMGKMQRFAATHPESATIESGPGHYSISISGDHPELAPDFDALIMIVALVAAGAVVLIGAAVVRRLHDTNRSGLWGLLPLPFLIIGLAAFGHVRRAMQNDGDLSLFFLLFLNNAVYIACLAALAFLLLRSGTTGENRFGPPPS